MYKYLLNNQIHFAPGFHEARRQAGFVLPEGFDPINYFIVRIWHWDEMEQDFSVEFFDTPGHQVFAEYDNALTCFKALAIDYPEEAGKEIKLELIQYHRGKVSTLQSKILFPPLLAKEA